MTENIPSHLQCIFQNISENDTNTIIQWWSQPRWIVTFRINHLMSTHEEIQKSLQWSNIPYSLWDISEDAYIIEKEHEYALRWLDIYTSGKIYVQSLSSMIPVLCMDLSENQKILDMTASPGSKTTQIASILRWKCSIVALEKFGIRFEKLSHTIQLQWAKNCVETLKMDALDIVSHYSEDEKKNQWKELFDRILIDAPCSSDGRIDLKNEKTFMWFSREKSIAKSLLQYEMLEQARKLLKTDWLIVYSTCAISRKENEDVIQKFLSKHSDFDLIPSPVPSEYTLEKNMNRWYPQSTMEGFFVAILKKNIK